MKVWKSESMEKYGEMKVSKNEKIETMNGDMY